MEEPNRKACEHCLNPDKSKWQTDCKYVGSYPSRRAFIRSTFDAPCYLDHADAEMARYRKQEARTWLLWTIGFAMIGALILWMNL